MGFQRSRRLWVKNRWVEGSGSRSKALGSWRDLSSGFAGEVEDWFVGSWRKGSRSKIDGSKALALSRRLWVRGMIWALGSPANSWVRGAKALGR